jgi:hypothetical protein
MLSKNGRRLKRYEALLKPARLVRIIEPLGDDSFEIEIANGLEHGDANTATPWARIEMVEDHQPRLFNSQKEGQAELFERRA